jgi:hypothetical protein
MKRASEGDHLETAEMSLLCFCHFMASTARSDAAKKMFQQYLRLEFQHLQKERSHDRIEAAGTVPTAVG